MYKKEKCPYSLLVILTFSTHMHVLPTLISSMIHALFKKKSMIHELRAASSFEPRSVKRYGNSLQRAKYQFN